MKKQILNFALVAAMIGTIAASCSSAKKAGGSDSTTVSDTAKMSTTPAATDTAKKDTTVKKDTMKTTNPPK